MIGIRSPRSCTRRITNWPARRLRAMRGACDPEELDVGCDEPCFEYLEHSQDVRQHEARQPTGPSRARSLREWLRLAVLCETVAPHGRAGRAPITSRPPRTGGRRRPGRGSDTAGGGKSDTPRKSSTVSDAAGGYATLRNRDGRDENPPPPTDSPLRRSSDRLPLRAQVPAPTRSARGRLRALRPPGPAEPSSSRSCAPRSRQPGRAPRAARRRAPRGLAGACRPPRGRRGRMPR